MWSWLVNLFLPSLECCECTTKVGPLYPWGNNRKRILYVCMPCATTNNYHPYLPEALGEK